MQWVHKCFKCYNECYVSSCHTVRKENEKDEVVFFTKRVILEDFIAKVTVSYFITYETVYAVIRETPEFHINKTLQLMLFLFKLHFPKYTQKMQVQLTFFGILPRYCLPHFYTAKEFVVLILTTRLIGLKSCEFTLWLPKVIHCK